MKKILLFITVATISLTVFGQSSGLIGPTQVAIGHVYQYCIAEADQNSLTEPIKIYIDNDEVFDLFQYCTQIFWDELGTHTLEVFHYPGGVKTLYDLVNVEVGGYVSYGYDAAGNRTSRDWITVVLKNAERIIENDSIDDPFMNSFIKVFPNPTSDFIHVDANYALENDVHIQLYTIQGKMIFDEKLSKEMHTIDLSDHLDGVYILKVIAQDKQKTYRIIKR